MAATAPPTIPTAPTTVPLRSNADQFSGAFEAFLVWFLGNFAIIVTALNTAYTNALAAFTSAAVASSAAASAVATANAAAWQSGLVYAQNAAAISQLNFQTYRKITASSSGTVDPRDDNTNWRVLSGNENGVFVPVPVTGTAIDLSLGNYFTDTVTATKTYTFINCPAGGFSFTLEVVLTGGSVQFPVSVKSPADSVPTMNTGKTQTFMFVTSNGGTRFRMVVAPNYTT